MHMYLGGEKFNFDICHPCRISSLDRLLVNSRPTSDKSLPQLLDCAISLSSSATRGGTTTGAQAFCFRFLSLLPDSDLSPSSFVPTVDNCSHWANTGCKLRDLTRRKGYFNVRVTSSYNIQCHLSDRYFVLN